MATFDLIIPLALKDYFIIYKNIYYINKYISPRCTYIITNRVLIPIISKEFCSKYHVCLIDEDSFAEGLSFSSIKNYMDKHFVSSRMYGWYFQQFLKMSFCEICNSDFYLIWDADTIPTSRLHFFDQNGRVLYTTRIDYNKPYFDTIKKLLPIKIFADYSFITEHMMVNTQLMKSLINEINDNCHIKGNYWFEKCINAIDPEVLHGFSEFEIYGNYVLNKVPEMYVVRQLTTYRDAGRLYGRYIPKRIISEKFEGKYDIVSLEMWQTPRFPYCIFDTLMKYILKFLTRMLRN